MSTNFNGNRISNIGDPVYDKDGINLRTLKKLLPQTEGNQLNLNGNPLVFEVNSTEYGRFDETQFRLQNTEFNINRFVNAEGEIDALNINNLSSNYNITMALNFRSDATTKFAAIKANNGFDVGTVNFLTFWVKNLSDDLTEHMRLQGNGSLLLGTTTDVESSLMTLESTNKGFLPPRMTTIERDAIVSPATGLILYNNNTNTLNYYNGFDWVTLYSNVSEIIVTTATTLTLNYGIDYVASGTIATFTLPAINTALVSRDNSITIKNRGTGDLTVVTDGALNVIFSTSLVNTFTLGVGDSVTLMPDGTYFNIE